jgi:rhodanese-related sulfurtransferase
MNRKYMIGIGGAMIFAIIVLGTLSFESFDPYAFTYSGKEVLTQLDEQAQLLTYQEYADLNARETMEVVDLREPEHFAAYNLKGARNIPMKQVLDKSLKDFFESETPKLLVDQDGLQANQVWIILHQMGYPNLYVLEGGNECLRAEGRELQPQTC